MASINTILKNALGIKGVIQNIEEDFITVPETDIDGNGVPFKRKIQVRVLNVAARPHAKMINRCPICKKECPAYDNGHNSKEKMLDKIRKMDSDKDFEEGNTSKYKTQFATYTRKWRTNNFGDMPVYIYGPSTRIKCPEHGVRNMYLPWQNGNARFTESFDRFVTWLSFRMTKQDISDLLMISWDTVGSCISRTRSLVEPDPSVRYNNLVNIGIDETSYKKGHKYITVVVNHDTNEIVWMHDKHGADILALFFEELTQEQRASIKVVTGDGARWIDSNIKKYIPNATRCVDAFHVVGWITDTLNELRKHLLNKARTDLSNMQKFVVDTDLQEQLTKQKELLRKADASLEEARTHKCSLSQEWEEKSKLAARKMRDARSALREALTPDDVAFAKLLKEEALEVETEASALKEELDTARALWKELCTTKKQISDTVRDLKAAIHAKKKETVVTDDDGNPISCEDAKAYRDMLKNGMYALLKNPENLTRNQGEILEILQNKYPDIHEGHQLKEEIRLLLHTDNPELAASGLDSWIEKARNSNLHKFDELANKIERHKQNIINTISLGMSNARIESTNNKIKVVIRRGYGFRLLENLIDMAMLICSDLPLDLPNRPSNNRKKIQKYYRKKRMEKAKATSGSKETTA